MTVFDNAWQILKEDLGDQLGTWAGNQAENRAYNDEQDQQDIEAAGGKEAYLEQQIAQLQQALEQKELLIQELRESMQNAFATIIAQGEGANPDAYTGGQ